MLEIFAYLSELVMFDRLYWIQYGSVELTV